MSDKQKRAQEEQGNTFDFSCCQGRAKMKPGEAKQYDCAGMMTQMMKMCSDVDSEATAPEETDSSDTIV